MKKLQALAALLAVTAAPAFAQSMGTVSSVNGVATITSGGKATTLSQGMPLAPNARIVTTSTSSAVVSLNNGCTLSVPPAHAVTLQPNLTCQQLQASLQPIAPVTSVPTTAVMGQSGNRFGGMDAATGVWLAGVAAFVIYEATQDDDAPISGR